MSEQQPRAAGLPSDSVRTSTGVRRIIAPATPSNLSRSAATSTQSLNSTTSERSSLSTVPSRRSPSVTDVLNPHSDNLKVNDVVFVNGSKPGTIRFLGTTTFAPGRWAGVELNDESGKNDGSVNNVRYFECEANHGIFVRPYRLTLEELPEPPPSMVGSRVTSRAASPTGSIRSTTESMIQRRVASRTEQPFMKITKSTSGATVCGNLRVGSRVIVNASSGAKVGTLRYLGPADFATGAWAGIELDFPCGKNDGSVAGKRYFTCAMNHGLFAPINKVTRETSAIAPSAAPNKLAPGSKLLPSASSSSLGPRRSSVTATQLPGGSNLRSTRKTGLSGSQESVSSITSSVSIKSTGSRIKLGVNSLSKDGSKVLPRNGAKPLGKNGSPATAMAGVIASTSSALHEAINEKEEHISQLLQERDIERGEVARAVAKSEELEEKINKIIADNAKALREKDDQIAELQQLLTEDELIQRELQEQLDETRKNLEIIEFKLQEEACEEEEQKKSGADPMKIKEENEEKEEELFQLQEELMRKDEKLFETSKLLESRQNEVNNLLKRIKEYEAQVSLFDERTKNYLKTIDDLNLKVKKSEDQFKKINEEKETFETIKRKLTEQISELESRSTSASSADSSQIKELSEKLTNKTSEIEQLKSSNVKLGKEAEESRNQLRRLESNLQAELREKERKIEDLLISEDHSRIELEKQSDIIQKLETKIDELLSSTGDSSDQLKEMSSELKKRNMELKRLEEEVIKLRSQIDLMDRDREKAMETMDILKKEILDKEKKIIALVDEAKYHDELIKTMKEDIVKSKNEKELILKSKEEEALKLNDKINQLLKKSGDSGQELSKMNEELSNQVKLREKIEEELRVTKNNLNKTEKEKVSFELKLNETKVNLSKKEEKLSVNEEKISELELQLRSLGEEKRKLQLHLEDTMRKHDESNAVLDKLNEENRDKQNTIKKMKDQVKTISEDLKREVNEKKRLIDEISEMKKSIGERDKALDQMSRKLHDSETELLRQIAFLKEEKMELVSYKERLSRDHQVTSSAVADRDLMIKSLKEQLDKSRQDFDRHRRELQDQLLSTRKDGHEIIDDLRGDLRQKNEEISNLRTSNDNLRSQIDSMADDISRLRKLQESLESRIEDSENMIQAKQTLIERLETENETSIENYKRRLSQEKGALLEKITELESSLNDNKVKQQELLDQINESIQQQNNLANSKVSGVTTTTSIAINSKNTSTSVTSSSTHSINSPTTKTAQTIFTASPSPSSGQQSANQETIEQYESQIEFLNSVIVDMQRKNDELKSKVQILEEFGDVGNEFDETAQTILNKMNGGSRRAPRLFCDICDCFDLHDTEDCPQQSSQLLLETTAQLTTSSTLTSNGHSKHGTRNLERSYCDNCESFGHLTKDCQNQSY